MELLAFMQDFARVFVYGATGDKESISPAKVPLDRKNKDLDFPGASLYIPDCTAIFQRMDLNQFSGIRHQLAAELRNKMEALG